MIQFSVIFLGIYVLLMAPQRGGTAQCPSPKYASDHVYHCCYCALVHNIRGPTPLFLSNNIFLSDEHKI